MQTVGNVKPVCLDGSLLLMILGVWSAISGHARHFHEHLSVENHALDICRSISEFHARQMKNDSVRIVDMAFAFPAVSP